MNALEQLVLVERRGRAMRLFVDRVRERGGVAEVEEDEDLVALRVRWITLRALARRERERAAA
jgi:hypothetical protein